MSPFELLEPASLDEALAALDPSDPQVRPIAGGTALVLMMKSRVFRPQRLVSLRRLNGDLRRVRVDDDGTLRIGALASLSELERSPLVAKAAPVVAQALRTLSNVRIRNVATLGGHLAHGDPHMDLPPILLTLGTRVRASSPTGERWIDLADLIVGYYETSLRGDELITEIAIPPLAAGTRAHYAKHTALSADDWPAVGVAVAFRRENGGLRDARVAVSAATERPIRLSAAEAVLTEGGGPETFAHAADAAADEVQTLGDLRGSAAYKREMVRVHVRRALHAADASTEGR
ncbi:MAG TPA: xanthine dehydrogenase family protein subunit M [Candidatus Limnocylindria bacterium]|nr:xanthine dehydrogenase family protein subunit M [Candidatus Limnocylindria bacterium]